MHGRPGDISIEKDPDKPGYCRFTFTLKVNKDKIKLIYDYMKMFSKTIAKNKGFYGNQVFNVPFLASGA